MRIAANGKVLAWLKPLDRKRSKRLNQYLEMESNECMDTIERCRQDRDEKERQIDYDLHQERRESSNWLENREIRVSEMTVEYESTLIATRIDIRKRLGQECPELLSNAELSKLEKSMLGALQIARLARRDDYERRAQAAGVLMHRSGERDAAQYGRLEELIHREIRQLELARTLLQKVKQTKWSWERSLAVAGLVVGVLTLIIAAIEAPHLRHWLSLSR